jgi:energy-coupling factor transport system permease protein
LIHTWAWIGWLISALVALSLTRNPLYLFLILLCIALVGWTQERRLSSESSQTQNLFPFSPLKFVLVIITLSALFNAVISHYGETVLFSLPEWLPFLGGPITLEALAFGAINGLVLGGIFSAFTVLNLALPVRSLVRLIPRAYYPVAVITSIAITFIPNATRQFQHIREAQAIRGHRVRGLRGWLPLIMPLLVGGLERALGLAEAMTARGFASSEGGNQTSLTRLGMVLGLLMLLGGWLLGLIEGWQLLGIGLMILGITLIAASLWLIGRSVPRTNYNREIWGVRDFVVLIGSIVVISAYLLPIPWIDQSTLHYNPYPILSLPGFDPLIGAATMGLLIPLFIIKTK